MNLSIINSAISEKKLISFNYKGHYRKVEPFLTGVHKTTGKDLLRAWFLDGYTSSGEYNTSMPSI